MLEQVPNFLFRKIVGLEIPNGLPLIFDVKSKCVKVSELLKYYIYYIKNLMS